MADVAVDPNAVNKARLLDELAKDPRYRAGILGAVKEKWPNVPVPEVDAAIAARSVVEPLQAEVEKLRSEIAMRDAAASTKEVRARHNLDDTEWKAVESLAVERQIGDLDTAADYYRHTQRVAAPRYAPTPISQPNMKGLWQNPTVWARDEAYKVLNEMATTGIRK